MLEIKKTQDGNHLNLALVGRLDTTTAPELERVVKGGLARVEELVFDLKELEYVSSAGLRVLLSAQKIMNKQGSMVVRNSSEDLMEIFEVTGFVDILDLE